jgi:hypothetical protein
LDDFNIAAFHVSNGWGWLHLCGGTPIEKIKLE